MEEFSWKQAVRPFLAGRKFLISHSSVEYARSLVEILAERSHYGTRLPERMVLEDKTTVDDMWEALAVVHAPSIVVDPSDRAAMLEAFAE
ncbi:hypothetical protein BMS3Bbin02_00593 [bacterium BMS3Bbin02]|nr:hypothetical protein BMS3Bbin02_00593 [bacterium BMS3Bbin02]